MTITFVIDEYPPDLRRAFIYKFKRASKAMLEHDMDTVGIYYTPTRRKGYRMVYEGVLQRCLADRILLDEEGGQYLPRLFTLTLLTLCVAVVSARPAVAQSLLDREWLGRATPAQVQMLLDRGADLTARDQHGGTPLHYAAMRNKTPAVVALLLDRGADLTARTQYGGTPLHGAAGYNETPAVVALLLDRGADLTARTQDGWTPLHGAAGYSETPAVVALLLDRGADPKLRDKEGKLPVEYAAENDELKGTAVYWRLHDAQF